MSGRAKERAWLFNRLTQFALLLVFSAQLAADAAPQAQFVRFTWNETLKKDGSEFRRVVLGNQGPVRIQVKQGNEHLIELDFDLKAHLKSNLVRNLFLLFNQSRSVGKTEKRTRQRTLKRTGESTIRVDYVDENTVRTKLVSVPGNDPKLQGIQVFFKNLCEQELALLELKTAFLRDRSRLPKKLEELDRNLKSSRVPAPDRMVPVLERISQDQAVSKDARTLAFRIARGIRSSMAAIGEGQGKEAKQATQSPRQSSPPQQAVSPPSDEGKIRDFVELVEMDVVVTDRKGNHVTDLRKEDFQVLQDGKPQKIHSLSYKWAQPPKADLPMEDSGTRSSAGGAVPSASTSSPELQKRLIAVVVDELGINLRNVPQIRRGLQEFFNTQIQPNDLVALVRTGLRTDEIFFTSDKTLLLKALDQVNYNPSSRPGLNHDTLVGRDVLVGSSRFRQTNLTLYTLDTLLTTVAMMEDLPFRKSLVFISGGLPLIYYSKIDAEIRSAMRQVTDACHRASVVIYSIEAEGLHALPRYSGDSERPQMGGGVRTGLDGRFDLTQETGGIFFHFRNSPHIATDRILQDQQGYYLLAYTPDSPSSRPAGRRFDKIKIKAKKRGLQVRARSAAFGN